MIKRFFFTFILSAALIASLSYRYIIFFHTARPVTIESPSQPYLTIVLIPLDSRPPCTQFVEQVGNMANVRLILPPPELLDHYRTPGKTAALRDWLRGAVQTADIAIVSTDMLIHGGLLASRLSTGTLSDVNQTLALLEELKQASA